MSDSSTSATLDVIMPALGMSQDSGEIVAWHKNVGDAVQPDDVLMEVETDKTTMELEAGFTGYVAEIRFEAGVSVGVGEVVAVLSETPGAGATQPNATETVAAKPETDARPVAASEVESDAQPGSTPDTKPEAKVDASPYPTHVDATSKPSASPRAAAVTTDQTITSGVVLASPKARLAAHEQGVNLTRILRGGVEQPVQMADVAAFNSAPVPNGRARSQLQARVAAMRFTHLADWVREVSDGAASASSIWCMFGAAAYRQAYNLGAAEEVSVRCECWINRELDMQCVNADGIGIMDMVHDNRVRLPDLLVRDMSGTALVAYQPADQDAGVSLSVITDADESLLLSLSFDEDEMTLPQALVLLQRLGERVEQPLRHLL